MRNITPKQGTLNHKYLRNLKKDSKGRELLRIQKIIKVYIETKTIVSAQVANNGRINQFNIIISTNSSILQLKISIGPLI